MLSHSFYTKMFVCLYLDSRRLYGARTHNNLFKYTGRRPLCQAVAPHQARKILRAALLDRLPAHVYTGVEKISIQFISHADTKELFS